MPDITKEKLVKLYVAFFGRAPTPAGIEYWKSYSNLKTLSEVSKSFFDQPETKKKYPNGLTNEEFMTEIYSNLFNRAPQDNEELYWVKELDNHHISRNNMILAVINGARNKDATVLDNKTTVALHYMDSDIADTGGFFLDKIDATPESVTEAIKLIDYLATNPKHPGNGNGDNGNGDNGNGDNGNGDNGNGDNGNGDNGNGDNGNGDNGNGDNGDNTSSVSFVSVTANNSSITVTLDNDGTIKIGDYTKATENKTATIDISALAKGQNELVALDSQNKVAKSGYSVNVGDDSDNTLSPDATNTSNKNLMYGKGGNDNIAGSDNDDTLYGGAGDDALRGGKGTDVMQGEAGGDTYIYANGDITGDEVLKDSGSDGTDILKLDNGVDFSGMTDGNGNQKIKSDMNIEQIIVINQANSDTLSITLSSDQISGETITVTNEDTSHDANIIINGSSKGDTIDLSSITTDTNSGNVIFNIDAGNGNDEIKGSSISDKIDAGAGNDTIDAGAGNDTIESISGTNQIKGGAGSDTINGGSDKDTIYGGDDNDAINGGSGNDDLYGETGEDTINGGSGADIITGGADSDTLDGGADGDTYIFNQISGVANGDIGSNEILSDSGDNNSGEDILRVSNTLDLGLIKSKNSTNKIHTDMGIERVHIFNPDNSDDYKILVNASQISGETLTFKNEYAKKVQVIIKDDINETVNLDNISKDETGGEIEFVLEGSSGDSNGTTGDDNITGDGNGNNINGGDGNDTINGGGGNDTIDGGNGNDTINGGSGDDTIKGGNGDDDINGGDGSDHLYGDTNNNENGDYDPNASHDDTIHGGNGNDYIYGEEGDDKLYGDDGDDEIHGGEGDDYIEGGADSDKLYGEGGNDTIYGHGLDDSNDDNATDYIYGGDGDDKLYGQGGGDHIEGGSGSDHIDGGSGNDTIYGNEEGNDGANNDDNIDYITGGSGEDTIYGQGGSDVIDGGDDNDHIYGGEGDDNIKGGDGNDYIEGNAGDDHLYGNGGDDRIRGGAGNDELVGGSGSDKLCGEDDNDKLYGGTGSDEMFGGAGVDLLSYTPKDSADYDYDKSGLGDDIIIGGAGSDEAHGGSDADTYFYDVGDIGDNEILRDRLKDDPNQNENEIDILMVARGVNFSTVTDGTTDSNKKTIHSGMRIEEIHIVDSPTNNDNDTVYFDFAQLSGETLAINSGELTYTDPQSTECNSTKSLSLNSNAKFLIADYSNSDSLDISNITNKDTSKILLIADGGENADNITAGNYATIYGVYGADTLKTANEQGNIRLFGDYIGNNNSDDNYGNQIDTNKYGGDTLEVMPNLSCNQANAIFQGANGEGNTGDGITKYCAILDAGYTDLDGNNNEPFVDSKHQDIFKIHKNTQYVDIIHFDKTDSDSNNHDKIYLESVSRDNNDKMYEVSLKNSDNTQQIFNIEDAKAIAISKFKSSDFADADYLLIKDEAKDPNNKYYNPNEYLFAREDTGDSSDVNIIMSITIENQYNHDLDISSGGDFVFF